MSLIASQIAASVENATLFRQVEQERARLAAILASSTDAILVVDYQGRIVLDNPAAWQVMNVTHSQQDRLLVESTQNEALIELFEQGLASGAGNKEIPVSDDRTYHAKLSPVSVNGVGVIGSVATIQDISHFKEVNQLKSDFVNSVSHDLRSPLSGIMIAVHLLPQVGDLNETQQELLESIENRVSSMSHLIEELLDVSKIEAGIDMEMEPCEIQPLVAEIATSFIPQAQDKSILLTQHHDHTTAPLISGNETRLRQIFYNLIANALKYTPEGGRGHGYHRHHRHP